MDQKELEIRLKLKSDFKHYASKCLKIRTKSGQILPFALNSAQLHVHNVIEKQKALTGKVRCIILKGRQQGISTYIEGRLYWLVTHRRGVRAFILTHESDATNNLFEMAQRYHQYCPDILRPKTTASSSKELLFGELDSGYRVGTAGNKGVGRSSTIQYLHGSEVSLWENAIEHAKGIMQAVPNEVGTEIFLESTARGIGNYYHEQWQLAEIGDSDYIPIFIPWFWQEEYKRDFEGEFKPNEEEIELMRLYGLTYHQLSWRRFKIKELSTGGGDGVRAFAQEYPNNAIDAFTMSEDDTLINPEIVMKARKTNCEAIGPLIVGCDPARFGNDRTSIIYRRGRQAFNLRYYAKKDTMEVAGLLHRIIQLDRPDRVCIDVGGLGAGVVDRLLELGHEGVITAVNAGSVPLDAKLYANKRSEMWGEMKNWLLNTPCQVPDEDALHSDLCAVKYKYDSINRLILEPKDKMKSRGLRSPDCGDALALTFALPFQSVQRNKIQSKSIAHDMMLANQRLKRIRAQ